MPEIGVRGVGFEPTKAYATGTGGPVEFEKFCRIDLKLAPKTASDHARQIKKFLLKVSGEPSEITREQIRDYLMSFADCSATVYKNLLSALKRYFRDYLDREDLVRSFRFPRHEYKPITVPSNYDLQRFYAQLNSPVERAVFLTYATTGLRRSEVLALKLSDLDLDKRTIIPNKAANNTKNTWCTFFNQEAEQALREYLLTKKEIAGDTRVFPYTARNMNKKFKKTGKKTGIQVTPQTLREWFCCQMGKLGVPDRYVDAFCGRVPQSILARHYTDFSPDRLKAIYDKAGLKVLS